MISIKTKAFYKSISNLYNNTSCLYYCTKHTHFTQRPINKKTN